MLLLRCWGEMEPLRKGGAVSGAVAQTPDPALPAPSVPLRVLMRLLLGECVEADGFGLPLRNHLTPVTLNANRNTGSQPFPPFFDLANSL